MKAEDILNFWFIELEPKDWFKKSIDLDNAIKNRFLSYHQKAIVDGFKEWRNTAKGSLAEIIILDQFSRNIFRDNARAFSADEKALKLSSLAIEKKFDLELSDTEKKFSLYAFYA